MKDEGLVRWGDNVTSKTGFATQFRLM